MLRRLAYVVVFAAAVAFVYGFVHQRDLSGRYEEYLESEENLVRTREHVVNLSSELEASRSRVENLDKDPVEMERTVRKVRGQVRSDEIVYRIEDVPTPPTTAAQAE